MSTETEPVTHKIRNRSETHEVFINADVTGAPVLVDDRPPHRAVEPSAVHLTYTRREEVWSLHARVYGLPTSGSRLMNDWINLHYLPARGDVPEVLPVWLRSIADELHPARPGGWPGTDPEGSYL